MQTLPKGVTDKDRNCLSSLYDKGFLQCRENDTEKLSQKLTVVISLGHQYSLATKNLKEL